MENYVVELKNVTKRFPGVVALRDMNMQIKPGEVHGLIGENGAGKSTLIKVLTNVHDKDEGQVIIDGEEVEFSNPNTIMEKGIACVYQELNIVRLLSITDNIFISGHIKGKSGLLDYDAMNKKSRELLSELGMDDVDVSKPAGHFGMGVQQMIEIAKALLADAKLVIMDEPTSSLGEKETEQLFETINRLRSENIAILFVSHKLEELFTICDRVTVMRDGEHILTEDIENMTEDKLISAMVGRSLDNLYPKELGERAEKYLEVKNLTSTGLFKNVSFDAYNGEVLGFAGLVGAGRTELMQAIFGNEPIDEGEIYINGEKANFSSPQKAIEGGIGLLTEDRKNQGLVLNESIKTNIIMASMKKLSHGAFLDQKEMNRVSDESVESLKIKIVSTEEPVSQLSGGNQQKVVISKWIVADADIYIFDEPTRGIDVGAKIEVYNVINDLVKQGKCVIMVSSELPEILGMSDRVIVMRLGKVMAEIERDSEHFNQESIMKAAWGGKLT